MNKPVKLVVVSLLVCMMAISVGSVAAMNGYQNGDLDRVQLREQLQDGSCGETEIDTEPTQEQLQEQLREQFRDGSCCENEELEEPVQERTQERSQFREQFRYGCTK